jgi:hypothetical protein
MRDEFIRHTDDISGWCTVLMIGVIAVGAMHAWAGDLAVKMFGITREEAKVTFFRTFQQYRTIVIAFNLVPFVALNLMGEG